MQVVIDIDENLFTRLFDCEEHSVIDMLNVCTAVRKGTLLPKGHGRIGDLSELETKIGNFIKHHKNLLEQTTPEVLVYMNHIFDGIRYTETIIEADKGE